MDHSFDQKNATNTGNFLSNNHYFTVSGELGKDKWQFSCANEQFSHW